MTPGDHVNMLLNFPVIDATGSATTHKATAFLLPGLKVMAVGSSTILPQAASPTASLTNGTVTTTTTAAERSLRA